MSEEAEVPEEAKQAEPALPEWDWVDRVIWTERMLAALGNGVKGKQWFSLIDKVYRPKDTLIYSHVDRMPRLMPWQNRRIGS